MSKIRARGRAKKDPMKRFIGPNRKNSSSEIYLTIRPDYPDRCNAYDSGEAYGRKWALENHATLQDVQEMASCKIETPSSALVNEMTGQSRTPKSVLINLGMILGVNTREIKNRTDKFYNSLRSYDAGFVAGALQAAR